MYFLKKGTRERERARFQNYKRVFSGWATHLTLRGRDSIPILIREIKYSNEMVLTIGVTGSDAGLTSETGHSVYLRVSTLMTHINFIRSRQVLIRFENAEVATSWRRNRRVGHKYRVRHYTSVIGSIRYSKAMKWTASLSNVDRMN